MLAARRTATCILAALALGAGAGCGDDEADTSGDAGGTATTQSDGTSVAKARPKPKVTVPKGPPPERLVTKDLIKGHGATAKNGDPLTVHYVGVLYSTGKQFDASYDRGEAFPLHLGVSQLIEGWHKGIRGMRVGGRRMLIIPPEDAYGAEGQPPTIPPNATLVFVIDLLSIG